MGKLRWLLGSHQALVRRQRSRLHTLFKKVVVASRRIAEGEETVHRIQEVGGSAIFVKTDVSKAAEVEELVNKTVNTYGRLDYAFNNAGIPASSPLIDISEGRSTN